MLDPQREATAKAVEPDVREIIAMVLALKNDTADEALKKRLYAIEYRLGRMLPTVVGTLHLNLPDVFCDIPRLSLHGNGGAAPT